MSTDTTPELYTRPILTHPLSGGSSVDRPHAARFSTRVEVVTVSQERPLRMFTQADHDEHTLEMGGMIGETVDERARRERRDHLTTLTMRLGVLATACVLWYAIAVLIHGVVT